MIPGIANISKPGYPTLPAHLHLMGSFLEFPASNSLMVQIVEITFHSYSCLLLLLGEEEENKLKAAFSLLWKMETLRLLFK